MTICYPYIVCCHYDRAQSCYNQLRLLIWSHWSETLITSAYFATYTNHYREIFPRKHLNMIPYKIEHLVVDHITKHSLLQVLRACVCDCCCIRTVYHYGVKQYMCCYSDVIQVIGVMVERNYNSTWITNGCSDNRSLYLMWVYRDAIVDCITSYVHFQHRLEDTNIVPIEVTTKLTDHHQ